MTDGELTAMVTFTRAELSRVPEPSTFFYGTFEELSAQEKADIEVARSAAAKLQAARKAVE